MVIRIFHIFDMIFFFLVEHPSTPRQVYMKDGVVELPGLRDKLPPEHGLAGRTPLEIMAASSEKRMAEGFTNRTGQLDY